MSGAAALLALREIASKKLVPQWSADRQHITIGSHTYPRKTLTPYRVRAKPDFFPLDALVVCIEDAFTHHQFKPARYIEEVMRQKVMAVPTVQRAEVLSYLRGEVSNDPYVDVQGLDKYEQQQATAANRTVTEGEQDERSGKRQRAGEGAIHLKPVSEWQVEDIVREECALNTHLSILQVNKKNFTPLLELFHKSSGSSRSKSSSSSSAVSSKDKSASKLDKPLPPMNPKDPNCGIPIIVVPAAVSAVISMYNVEQFLVNGVFEAGDRVRSEKGAAKPPSPLLVTRSSYYDPSKTVTYQVLDDVSVLKEEDWSRVVAVFVSGANWQFADWPKKTWPNPAAIFENVCAFHLHFDDESLHPNIVQWRTHRLPISKNKRHGDRGVVLDFWHLLTEFIAARNTTKRLFI